MEEDADLPTELLESVQQTVGREVKLTLSRKVQLEVKGDRVETRVLALAFHRAFLLTARVPSKVELSFNYLEIQEISSNRPTQLLLQCERCSCSLLFVSVEEVEEVVGHLGTSLLRISPSGPVLSMMRKLALHPPDRSLSLWDEQRSADLGPCGGFSHQYQCVCDLLGSPYREEVQWDVDTIYLTQDTRELNLQDFVHLETSDLVAIVAVLEHNQWFSRLTSRDFKLPTDVSDQIVRVVSRSTRLEELLLDNAGLKSDFAQKLAAALAHNSASSLHTVNLSNNSLEDKGASALSSPFSKLPTGLKQLKLSRTSLSAKGVNAVCEALCVNPAVASTLTHLDLSGNCLRGDELQNLHNFLSRRNSVEHLDLSNTECNLEQVCASLLRGSLKNLSVLNVSKTIFSHRKGRDVPPSFRQFFSSAQALTSVSLSGTKLPVEALKSLLLGLGSNSNLSDVSLDLSCCELRSAGSQVLESCIAEIPNISSLNVSDNSLDLDLITLLDWLAKNRSIRHLSLGKNFNNIKSKNLSSVLDHLVHLIQEEDSPLTSLSLADSKLKADVSVVLSALGSNSSLTLLDISGNYMGDLGAKMLAKALQINSKLRTIFWDRNNISPQGLQDVAAALEKNYTIRFMPVPIMDAAQALKSNPEKTADALLKMEQYLLRNHETRKYLQEQAYRLQQGIVTSTTQQMMDMMCVRVQDQLNSLRFSETGSVRDDVEAAENLMTDARSSKTLLPSMYHLKSATSRPPSVAALQDKLHTMAGELASVIEEQLQAMLVSMVDAAESLCPHVMKRRGLRQELLKAGGARMTIPRCFITSTLLEQSGVDIVNKISEVKLSVASFLADRIVDEILECLSRSQRTLADLLSGKDQPLLRQGPPTETQVLDETVLHLEVREEAQRPERRLEDQESCMMTPKSKRKSILVRMLRPVSVAFEMEFDLDKALEDVPVHVEDSPHPPPPPPAATVPPDAKPISLGELPAPEHQTLEHLTKLRPRPVPRTRTRTRRRTRTKPSRPAEEQNCIMGKLDEGLDDFFSKRVTNLRFKRPSVKAPPTSQQHKVARGGESRRSSFFNLIKSRTSRSEKSHGPAAVAPSPPPASTHEEAPPAGAAAAVEPDPVLHRVPSSNCGGSEAKRSPLCPEPAKEVEHVEDRVEQTKGSVRTENPLVPRHIGVPVMGLDLLAEMKARQEKMAVKKVKRVEECELSGDKASPDGDQDIPEPTPRSKPLPVTSHSQGPQTPTGPQSPTRPRFHNPNSPRPQSGTGPESVTGSSSQIPTDTLSGTGSGSQSPTGPRNPNASGSQSPSSHQLPTSPRLQNPTCPSPQSGPRHLKTSESQSPAGSQSPTGVRLQIPTDPGSQSPTSPQSLPDLRPQSPTGPGSQSPTSPQSLPDLRPQSPTGPGSQSPTDIESSSVTDEDLEAPRAPLPAPRLKRAPSERDDLSRVPEAPLTPGDGSRRSGGDVDLHGFELKLPDQQNSSSQSENRSTDQTPSS